MHRVKNLFGKALRTTNRPIAAEAARNVRERPDARPGNLSAHKLHGIGPIRPVNDLGSDFIASFLRCCIPFARVARPI